MENLSEFILVVNQRCCIDIKRRERRITYHRSTIYRQVQKEREKLGLLKHKQTTGDKDMIAKNVTNSKPYHRLIEYHLQGCNDIPQFILHEEVSTDVREEVSKDVDEPVPSGSINELPSSLGISSSSSFFVMHIV